MVSDALRTISKAEKELEYMTDNGEKTEATEKQLKEMRRLTEQAAFSTIRTAEKWGRAAMEQTKEKIVEAKEIIL